MMLCKVLKLKQFQTLNQSFGSWSEDSALSFQFSLNYLVPLSSSARETQMRQRQTSVLGGRLLKIFAGLLILLVAAGLGAWFFPQPVLTVDSGPVRAEVMVVLGGGGPERPERAAELFQAGEAPLIICSGLGDAHAHKAHLVNAGIPAAAVLLENKSHTTRENAEFTIALLQARHITNAIIVTSWYHSRRALACFEHYAPDIRFYSRPAYFNTPKSEWRQRDRLRIKAEYAKLLGYWLIYGVCPL
jgi:uncharacterized SAM-binding protein YcdF (DUF218 family)